MQKKLLLLILLAFGMSCQQKDEKQSMPEQKAGYPVFSWEHVPVYAHLGKTSDDFTPYEATFLAEHYDFIAIEKAQAYEKYGNTEQGIYQAARQLKASNPQMKVLFYMNAVIAYPMYDAHKTFLTHPDWVLRDKDGDPVTWHSDQKQTYDLSRPDLREWWTDVIQEAMQKAPMDGVFIDAIPKISMAEQRNKKNWGEDKYRQVEEGLGLLFKELDQKIGTEKLIIYNGIRGLLDNWRDGGLRYLEYADGATVEHFGEFATAEKEQIANDIELIKKTGQQGKIAIVKGWPGFTWIDDLDEPYKAKVEMARKNITFPLACFLVAAQEYAYFCYSWGYREQHGWFEWYPEFDKPLGPPKGQAVKEDWQYTREFEHASVWVDLETKQARIDWE